MHALERLAVASSWLWQSYDQGKEEKNSQELPGAKVSTHHYSAANSIIPLSEKKAFCQEDSEELIKMQITSRDFCAVEE